MGVPLILSHAVHAMNLFIDRTLLAWYSADAFTAALQAGVFQWTVLTLFFMTVSYASTFVAQFVGARNERMIGAVVWQAVWLALAGGIILISVARLGYPIFRWIGHEGDLPLLEGQYFVYMTTCGILFLTNGAIASFFTGLERTTLVLMVNLASCFLNVCLNTWFIFEPIWVFPEGIRGAAVATAISAFFGIVIYIALILANPEYERRYALLSSWRPNPLLLRRILRFGFPTGVHGVIDMTGFTTFLLVVGFFGYQAQMATNMAMNLNLVLFIPAIGFHIAVQILTGRFRGEKNDHQIEHLASGAAVVLLIYMAMVTVIYVVFPAQFLHFFRGGMPEAEWNNVLALARLLLLFVAAYTTFDALMLVYSGILKGAGDTRFVMWVSVFVSQLMLTWPCILFAVFRERFANPLHGLYAAWAACTLYIIFLASINAYRYRTGRWRMIEMIDHDAPPAPDKAAA